MAEKEKFMFPDRNVFPTDDLIFSIIGEKKTLWDHIMQYASDNYKDISGIWNYYNDGKQWLFKLTQKKKTIFWAAILEDTFRITFYFGDKAEPVIEASELPDSVKHDFKTGKRYGKIRAISLKINKTSDIEIVKTLIAIKSKIK
ncbi:MAG: DUF3788 domain-containing protein [Bacteroidales bacterium]|nr:DUF3788 domain-containing protein [Bacteroidales bacterium]